MADKLETIQILFVKRNARKRGKTSSDDYNDMIDELAHDLAAFNTQWNNSLVPLTSALPDGTVDSSIDAFTNGLSGRHMYTDADATSTYNSSYYNTLSSRPYSVLEQFANVYGEIESVRNDLSADIQSATPTAEQIVIADAGGYYTATNVEAALAEVRTSVNAITLGALDLSAVAQDYLPLDDDTYDIGTALKRIQDIYLGPASLHIIGYAAESESPSDKNYRFSINSSTGKLELIENNSSTIIAQFGTTGTSFPAGGGGSVPIDDLTDVEITNVLSGHALVYTGTEWENKNLELDNLDSVFISSPTVNHVLHHSGSGWQNKQLEFDDLSNASTSGPAYQDLLMYTGSVWTNRDALLRLDLDENVNMGSPGAGKGRIWVKDTAPTTLWFTDDTGVEYSVLGGTFNQLYVYSGIVVGTGGGSSAQYMIDVYDVDHAGIRVRGDTNGSGTGNAFVAFDRSDGDMWGSVGFSNSQAADPAEIILTDHLDDSFILHADDPNRTATMQFATNRRVRMTFAVSGNMGIGTEDPHPAAALDVNAGYFDDQGVYQLGGLLVPRMNNTALAALDKVDGMIVYNTTDERLETCVSGVWFNITHEVPTPLTVIGNPATDNIAIFQNSTALKSDNGLRYTSDRFETNQAYISSGLFDTLDVGNNGIVLGDSSRTVDGGLQWTSLGGLQLYDSGWTRVDGNVFKVGTPVNTRGAFWTGDGTLGHHEDFVIAEPTAGRKQLQMGDPSDIVSDNGPAAIFGGSVSKNVVLVTPFGVSETQPLEFYHKTAFGTRDKILWTTDEGGTRNRFADIIMDTFNASSGSRLAFRTALNNSGAMNAGLVIDENGRVAINIPYDNAAIPVAEALEINGGLKVGANSSDEDGVIRYLSNTFNVRENGEWKSITAETPPAGDDTYIQYALSGVFGASSNFRWSEYDHQLLISGYIQTDSRSSVQAIPGMSAIWVKDTSPSTLWFTDDTDTDHELLLADDPDIISRAGTPSNDQIAVFTDSNTIEGSDKFTYINGEMTLSGVIRLNETANPSTTIPGTGQIWVKNESPNELWFSDDDGNHYQLGSGGVSTQGNPADNQVAIWVNSGTIEGDSLFTYDGVNVDVGWNGNFQYTATRGSMVIALGSGDLNTYTTLRNTTDHPIRISTNNSNTAINQISIQDGSMHIGGITPGDEKLIVNGAIQIGNASNTTNGTIRWSGTDFEGRKGGEWISLTADTPTESDGSVSGLIQQGDGAGNFVAGPLLQWWDDQLLIGDNGNNPTYAIDPFGRTVIHDFDGGKLSLERVGASVSNNDVLGSINTSATHSSFVRYVGRMETTADGDWGSNYAYGAKTYFYLQSSGVSDEFTDSPVLALFGSNKQVSVGGLTTHTEALNVNGAVLIGDSVGLTNGTIRWTGSDFEGRKGGEWVSLTSGGGTGQVKRTVTATKSSNYTASAGEFIRCNPTGGGFTITLPDALNIDGEEVVVKNATSSTNTITIDTTGADTIDGSSSTTITEAWKSLTFISDGSNWSII